MMKTSPLSKKCPRCGASPGDLCRAVKHSRTVTPGTAIKHVHAARRAYNKDFYSKWSKAITRLQFTKV